MNDVSFELMMDMKRELSEIFNIMKSYWLLIEWFWLMVFVGVSNFEGTLFFINIEWILLFSFHLIDVTRWFEELMKEMGKIWKVNWVFLIPLISVLFAVFDEMVVPVIVWVFPTCSHELEYLRYHMCMNDVEWDECVDEHDCDWRWNERNQESKTFLHISSNEGRAQHYHIDEKSLANGVWAIQPPTLRW